MITIDALVKKYKKKCVLDHVTFHAKDNVIGLLGPNGSGKTTLFRILTGILNKTSGSINYKNRKGNDVMVKECVIGYLPQNFGLIKNYTLKEHMKYFACLKGIPKEMWNAEINSSLKAVHLSDMKDVKCGKLSGGMVRRAGIAQAIIGEPDLLLFDEPTTGLDPEERIRFQNTVNTLRGMCTIIISSHIIDDIVKVSDETLVLKEGKLLYQGKTKDLALLGQGRTYTMTQNESMHWQESGINIKTYSMESGDTMVRFLYLKNGRYDNPKAVEVAAQAEDGYMYLLKCEGKPGD